jgi:hypothetical protein
MGDKNLAWLAALSATDKRNDVNLTGAAKSRRAWNSKDTAIPSA